MASFNFRMQSVMTLRERERDAAAESYQQAMLAISKLENEIAELLQEHASQQPLQSNSSTGVVQAQRMLESQRYQMYLLQEVAQLRQQKQLVEQEKERRRMILVRCEQAVRSLEKLKDRQRADWEQLELTREQNALDQWAGFRYWKDSLTEPSDS